MRIQHNIMAMNAYRNYSNNTSALSKNLERLSSGYKINRAGDDAAGLAISEKMRAQITGLEAAQKNVKDGVSLVNTAEGAMQEIQDMLNRMVSLATQSSNGTYDNEVDRKNLQAEIDQLKSEINRIADSANFNGIKLLDGSLDVNGDLTTKVDFKVLGEDGTAAVGSLPTVGQDLGVNTVLHNNADGEAGTEFSVDFHDYSFSNKTGDKMTIEIGDDLTIELEALADGDAISGKDIVSAIMNGTVASKYNVTVNGTAYNKGDTFQINNQDVQLVETADPAKADRLSFQQVKAPTSEADQIDGAMSVKISGVSTAATSETKTTGFEFTLDSTTLKAGQEISIGDDSFIYQGNDFETELTAAVGSKYDVDIDTGTNKVTLTAKEGTTVPDSLSVTVADVTDQVVDADNATAVGGATAGATTNAMTGAVAVGNEVVIKIGDKYMDAFEVTALGSATTPVEVKLSFNGEESANLTAEIDDNGKIVVKDSTGAEGNNTVTVYYGTADAGESLGGLGGTAGTAAKAEYDISGWEGGTLKIQDTNNASDAVEIAWDTDAATSLANAKADLAAQGITATYNETSGKVTLEYANISGTDTPAALDVRYKSEISVETTAVTEDVAGTDETDAGFSGDYNVSTTDIKQVTAEGQHRLASTSFELTKGMIEDGAKLQIGDSTYTFTTKEGTKDGVYIGDVKDLSNISDTELSTIAKRLTDAAADNALYSVGNSGSKITLTETVDHDALYTNDDGSSTDDWDLRTVEGIEKSLGYTGAAKSTNKGLILQIGETSDSFNQLSVSVGDMHVSAMVDENGVSIEDIDISTPAGAQAAINTIKAAIKKLYS